MDWNKLILMLVVLAIYIPMVFMGSNTFFPDYSRTDRPYLDCYVKPASLEGDTAADAAEREACLEQQRAEEQAWEQGKRQNDAKKYIFVLAVNIVALLAIFFISVPESVTLGVFLGAALATAFSTLAWFETRSKVGFALVVVTFITVITFIVKNKVLFVPKKKKR